MSVSSRDNNFPINALHKFIVVYVFVSFVSHFIPYPMALALRCPSNVAHGNHSHPYETACLWRTSYSPHDRWRPRTYGINDRILYIWAHGQKLLVLIWRNMLQWQVNIIIKGTYMSISSFFFGFQLDKTAIAFFFALLLLLLLLFYLLLVCYSGWDVTIACEPFLLRCRLQRDGDSVDFGSPEAFAMIFFLQTSKPDLFMKLSWLE